MEFEEMVVAQTTTTCLHTELSVSRASWRFCSDSTITGSADFKNLRYDLHQSV